MSEEERKWREIHKSLLAIEANIISCNENVRGIADAVGRIESALKEASSVGELKLTVYQELPAAEDELYEKAKELIIKAGSASTSYLQERIGIGYVRAAHLIDQLEKEGVIGPGQGSRPRWVLERDS